MLSQPQREVMLSQPQRELMLSQPREIETGEAHADHAAVERLYAHLEQALIAIGYLDPAEPKRLMPRLRRLFSRTRLEVSEVDLLRGICKQMEKLAAAERAGVLASEKAARKCSNA